VDFLLQATSLYIWSVTLAMTIDYCCHVRAITYMWAMVLVASDHIGNAFDGPTTKIEVSGD
jgi:hypothetical protein